MFLLTVYGLPNGLVAIILFIAASYLFKYFKNLKAKPWEKISAYGFVFWVYSVSLAGALGVMSVSFEIVWNIIKYSSFIAGLSLLIGLVVKFIVKPILTK